jgi:HAD superfamily phosphoserine phosphatase-like hydrolase
MNAKPLILFDMDGVLFQGHNFWLELHSKYGTAEEGTRLAEKYLETDYDQLAVEVINKLWRGKPAKPFFDLVNRREYVPGVPELIAELKHSGFTLGIISSGPKQLADRVCAELGIDIIRANQLTFKNGLINGVDVEVADNEKHKVAWEIQANLGFASGQTMYVGDSKPDAHMKKAADFIIAYDSNSPELLATADKILRTGEMIQVAEIARTHFRLDEVCY